MYLNTYELAMYFSVRPVYMSMLMGAAIAVIMLGFMLHMLKNRG